MRLDDASIFPVGILFSFSAWFKDTLVPRQNRDWRPGAGSPPFFALREYMLGD